MIDEQRAREIGREHAGLAIEAGGSDPTDCEGNSLLPTEPMDGDWGAFYDLADCERDEMPADVAAAYATAYGERMDAAIQAIAEASASYGARLRAAPPQLSLAEGSRAMFREQNLRARAGLTWDEMGLGEALS